MKIIKTQKTSRPRSAGDGFSLIEVTISIAITAVALVSLMGMLPAGMKTMREAADRAVETRIHQQVLSEIQLAKWDARYKYDYRAQGGAGLRFYDDQGILIESGDTDFDLKHVYTARVNVPKSGQKLPNSLGSKVYPGIYIPVSINQQSELDPNLQLVIVEITSVLDPGFDFNDEKFSKVIRTFQATIAKMGKAF